MKQIELLYFEDISPFHEAVFGFPIIGKLSMRQMVIIGFSAVVSWGIYQSSGNLLSMIPLAIGGYLGLKRFNVKPFESQLLSMIRFFLLKRRVTPQSAEPAACARPRLRREKSKRIAKPVLFQPKPHATKKEVKVRNVFTDPLKPVRLQIKLTTPDRRPIANTQTRVEFDGNVIATLSTNNNGEIEVLVIPQTFGKKRLAIFAEGYELPIVEEILAVRTLQPA